MDVFGRGRKEIPGPAPVAQKVFVEFVLPELPADLGDELVDVAHVVPRADQIVSLWEEVLENLARRNWDDLARRLGARVKIQHTSRGKGKLVLAYNSLDELDGILSHIK